MSSTAKISISIPDKELLKWAKERSKKTGVSLSAVFADAIRFERQMEARRAFVAEMGTDAVPTPEEAAAIRAELGLAASVRTPPFKKKGTAKGRSRTAALGTAKR